MANTANNTCHKFYGCQLLADFKNSIIFFVSLSVKLARTLM